MRPGDVDAASEADLLVTFWGPPRRLADCAWAHQCGSVAEAIAAVDRITDVLPARQLVADLTP
ncbi:MAG TPA: hypothetical protein VGF70_14655 [Solirubrobacteraceae bacterium]